MLLTLVYGGEHYVTDILVGYLYAAAAVFGVKAYFDRAESRRSSADQQTATPGEPHPAGHDYSHRGTDR
jgi:membrane-associated phospholipid phosphatase